MDQAASDSNDMEKKVKNIYHVMAYSTNCEEALQAKIINLLANYQRPTDQKKKKKRIQN